MDKNKKTKKCPLFFKFKTFTYYTSLEKKLG